MSNQTKNQLSSPQLDQAGFPKIIPENIDYLGASEDGEVYWTSGNSGETRKLSYQSKTGSFKWVSVDQPGPSLKKKLTGQSDKNSQSQSQSQSQDTNLMSKPVKKSSSFSQALLVFLLLSEQRKKSQARQQEEAVDQLQQQFGYQAGLSAQTETSLIGEDQVQMATNDSMATRTLTAYNNQNLVPTSSPANQQLIKDDQQKKNFFVRNRQGGCFYGLLGGNPYTKTSFFRKFVCPNEQQITLYGIINDPNQSLLFLQSSFGENLCQLLIGEGDLYGTTYDDRRQRLDELILNYLTGYLQSQRVTAGGSLVLQINDLIQLISFNTPLETTVFWREEVVYPNSIQNQGDLFLRSFSTDEIPALDEYQIVVGSQAFWDDNRPGMVQSIWKLVIGDENLEQLIGNRQEQDKVAICQRLVEKTSQKASYQNEDVSVIYSQIPSSRSLEF